MSFYETRARAVRQFYGNIAEADWPKYQYNVWYDPDANKCFPVEPDNNENAHALSKSTQFYAMFNKPLPE
jgi:hypothetical protein